MYGFIFYGIYRTLNYTVVSKGKEKQEDRRISAVHITNVVIGANIFTIDGIFENKLNIDVENIIQIDEIVLAIALYLLLWAFTELLYNRRLNQLSEKYEPIYNKYKYLDKIIGFGAFPISAIFFLLLGTP